MKSRSTSTKLRVLTWTLSVAFICFTSLFALDAIHPGDPPLHVLSAVGTHLIPSGVLLVVFLLSIKWEWVGALAYTAIALLYTLITLKHPDWIVLIAGPLYVMGILYAVMWFQRRSHHGRSSM